MRGTVRDRRYERESVAYEEFLAAAWTMLTAAKAHHAMREIADVDVRRTRLEQDLAETVPKAQRALLRLTLDEDSADIRSLYEQARGAYRGHQALELLIKGLPRSADHCRAYSSSGGGSRRARTSR